MTALTFHTTQFNTDAFVMNQLHEQGFISNPVGKAKSIWLTPEGMEQGRQIADRLFGVRAQGV